MITCGCYYHKPPIRRLLLNFWSAWLEEQIKKQRILNLDAFLKIMQFLKKDQLVFLENIIWKSYHWSGRLEKGTQTKKEPHWSFFLLKLLWKLWASFFRWFWNKHAYRHAFVIWTSLNFLIFLRGERTIG